MQTKSTDPDKNCAENDRIGECDSESPFYLVPFIYGPEPRLSMEFWCEECVENAFDMEIGDDGEVLFNGMKVTEVWERYQNGENPSEFIDWDDIE
jgi:hypothetical protein